MSESHFPQFVELKIEDIFVLLSKIIIWSVFVIIFPQYPDAKSNDIPEMNWDPNTDHLYSTISSEAKKILTKKWAGYLCFGDKIWFMSVGGMYCEALDAQRILSALQDMCIAYQDGCWFLIWWHAVCKCIGNIQIKTKRGEKQQQEFRIGNILEVLLILNWNQSSGGLCLWALSRKGLVTGSQC